MKTYDHFAFQVSDLDAAIPFYIEKLGFTFISRAVDTAEQEAYAFLTLGDLRLELLQYLHLSHYPRPEIKPPYCPHLALETQDMEKTVAQLKQNGVNIVRGPLKIEGEATWVYCSDLDNNVLEYIQWLNR